MTIAKVQHLKKHQLTDGFVELLKLGRRYYVCRGFHEDQCPDTWFDMSRQDACAVIEKIMRQDAYA